jgi:hypothetical protein
MYPRQDSNLRPQDYQSTVFEGSHRLSLALAAQRISLRQRYQRLPLIRGAFRSKAMNKRWPSASLFRDSAAEIPTRPPFQHADEPLANGRPLYWLQRVCRPTGNLGDKPLRCLPQSVGPAISNQLVCLPTDFGTPVVPRDAHRRRTFTGLVSVGAETKWAKKWPTDKRNPKGTPT